MVALILSEKFPSIEHCNIYVPEKKVNVLVDKLAHLIYELFVLQDDVEVDPNDENEMIIPTCPNICCKILNFFRIYF